MPYGQTRTRVRVYHPEGERLPGAGDLADQSGRADREAEKVVLPAWEEPRRMFECWSRVVWATPGRHGRPRKGKRMQRLGRM